MTATECVLKKTDNSGTTYYYYDSSNNLIGMTKGDDTLLFYYDSEGNVTSFRYGGTMYYYIKNLQGDIVEIIDEFGTVQASYVYDAWGNIQSETGEPNLRRINPFRYRGYVYDNETGLYYLQSRYYDPITGGFLNADSHDMLLENQGNVLQYNIFCYVFNNMIMHSDFDGKGAFFVGFGVQLAFSIGTISGGIELVWLLSKKVSTYGQSRAIPFVYFFCSFNSGKKNIKTFESYIKPLYKNPMKLLNPKNLVKGISISLCFFVVFGYSNFKNPQSYAGTSSSTSISIFKGVIFGATSNTGFCVGGGYIFGGKGFNFSVSTCRSWLLSGKGGIFQKLYNNVKSQTNKYR